MMSKEKNVAAQEKFGEAINTGKLEMIREVVADDLKDHDPAPSQAPGPQGLIDFFSQMRTAFRDFHVEVEHLVTDEENVAFAYTATGTHQGDFMGIAATGKNFKIRGMQIGRFENGKLAERWGSSDELGLLKQLGAKPAK